MVANKASTNNRQLAARLPPAKKSQLPDWRVAARRQQAYYLSMPGACNSVGKVLGSGVRHQPAICAVGFAAEMHLNTDPDTKSSLCQGALLLQMPTAYAAAG